MQRGHVGSEAVSGLARGRSQFVGRASACGLEMVGGGPAPARPLRPRSSSQAQHGPLTKARAPSWPRGVRAEGESVGPIGPGTAAAVPRATAVTSKRRARPQPAQPGKRSRAAHVNQLMHMCGKFTVSWCVASACFASEVVCRAATLWGAAAQDFSANHATSSATPSAAPMRLGSQMGTLCKVQGRQGHVGG